MADFKISGRMSVKTLQEQFKKSYGGTLRIYYGAKFADPGVTLASIRAKGKAGGDFTCSGNMHVGRFEDELKENFGIKVQVANHDNSALVDDKTTLSNSGK